MSVVRYRQSDLGVGPVTPPDTAIPATVQQQLKATALLSNGRKKAETSGGVWAVSDPTLASVDANGLVTALAAGTLNVTAMAGK